MRPLCDVIRATMPRELRDIIYTHLLGKDIHLVAGAKALTESQLPLRKKLPVLDHLLCQHYMQASYMGPELHNELVARFCETATLRFVDVKASGVRHILRGSDPFGSGTMISQRLRSFTFVVQDPRRWNDFKNHVAIGLEALAEFASSGCKVIVEVEQEANITLARILAHIGRGLKLAQQAGLKVEIRRAGKEVVMWEEIDVEVDEDSGTVPYRWNAQPLFSPTEL